MSGTDSKGLNRGDGMTDARGVLIEPGDTAIYGFGVGRSVAMAEGVIRDDGHGRVSTTPSGRVWVTIVRRSYGGGEQDRVHIAPDRLVVLKEAYTADSMVSQAFLPDSPLSTQDQENLIKLRERVAGTRSSIAALEKPGAPVPQWLKSEFQRSWLERSGIDPEDRTAVIAWALDKEHTWLAEYVTKLDALEAKMEANGDL
jgi:hypothetical protein